MQPQRLPGFYVEGRNYGLRYSQARARARYLSAEYSRAVDIQYVDPHGDVSLFGTIFASNERVTLSGMRASRMIVDDIHGDPLAAV